MRKFNIVSYLALPKSTKLEELHEMELKNVNIKCICQHEVVLYHLASFEAKDIQHAKRIAPDIAKSVVYTVWSRNNKLLFTEGYTHESKRNKVCK